MNSLRQEPTRTSITQSEKTLKMADIFITNYVTSKDQVLNQHTKNPLNFVIHASIFFILVLLANSMVILAGDTFSYNSAYYLGTTGMGDDYV